MPKTSKTAHDIPTEMLSSLRVPTVLSTADQREIFLFLCRNNGADAERRVHPTKAYVSHEDLVPALFAAQEVGFCEGLRPYHFPRIKGLWTQQQWVDEILAKRVCELRDNQFGGDLIKLCAHGNARAFLKPIIEVIHGREYRVSVLQPLGAVYDSSPFKIVSRYLEIVGLQEQYKDLRPYHFSSASQGTYQNDEVALEVVCKKIDSLLREGPYDGNLARLCAEVTQREFLSPFADTVAGVNVNVKMACAAQAFDWSLYGMLKAYIVARGLEGEFFGFRPYHMKTTSQATYNNPLYVREVLLKSCNHQIATTFGGDKAAFLARGTLPQICSPFVERIAGYDFLISPDSAVKAFGESSTRIKRLLT